MAQDLERLYDEYNSKYWNSRLPKIPVKFGKTERGHAAEYWDDPPRIHIHPIWKRVGAWRYISLLLLHEMSHVHLRNESVEFHGHKFQREMKRLAKCGAFRNLW